MKHITTLLACSFVFFFSTCTKKSIDLEIYEKDCRNFKIEHVTYQNITDPSCGGGALSGQFKVSFDINGEDKCVNRIVTYPLFYNNKNNVLAAPIFKDTFYLGEPNLVINGKHITFTFNYAFTNAGDADALAFINMRFETQNEIGNASNSQEIRINMSCSIPDPSSYNKPKATVPVTTKNITIRFWDHAAEDGDIISVNINGVWVMENYMIKNAGDTFPFTINNGTNTVLVYAVNQGKSGPNTLSLAVNDGSEIKLEPELLTGESIHITLP